MTKLSRIWLFGPLQIILALCCVSGGWYFGLHVAQAGLTSMGRQIRPYSDLVPAWYGSRAILFDRADPYSAQATSEIQTTIYGTQVGPEVDQQQFTYPVYSAFLFLPFAALPFTVAQVLAFVVFAVLTGCSVYWWAGKATTQYLIVTTLMVFASFPFFFALHCRQPTLLIAGILAGAFFAARSGRLVLCGVLLAVATAKPQLAIGVALPMVAWALNDLRQRKRVLLSFVGTGLVLMAGSEIFRHSWFIEWLGVLRSYGSYVAAKPLLVLSMGPMVGNIFSVLLLVSIAYVIWKWREDLPFSIAYCVPAFSLVIRFHFYDEILLLAPITWLMLNRFRFTRWTSRILFAAVWISLCMGWVLMIAISLLYMVNQRASLIVWQFPLGLAGSLPFLVFFALWQQAFLIRSRLFIRYSL